MRLRDFRREASSWYGMELANARETAGIPLIITSLNPSSAPAIGPRGSRKPPRSRCASMHTDLELPVALGRKKASASPWFHPLAQHYPCLSNEAAHPARPPAQAGRSASPLLNRRCAQAHANRNVALMTWKSNWRHRIRSL